MQGKINKVRIRVYSICFLLVVISACKSNAVVYQTGDAVSLHDSVIINDMELLHQGLIPENSTKAFRSDSLSFEVLERLDAFTDSGFVVVKRNGRDNATGERFVLSHVSVPDTKHLTSYERIRIPYCVLLVYRSSEKGWVLSSAHNIFERYKYVEQADSTIDPYLVYSSDCDGVEGNFSCLAYLYSLNKNSLHKEFQEEGNLFVQSFGLTPDKYSDFEKGDTIDDHYEIHPLKDMDRTFSVVRTTQIFEGMETNKLHSRKVVTEFIYRHTGRSFDRKMSYSKEFTNQEE